MDDSHKGLRKGTWTAEEDSLLRKCIDKYGEGKWHLVPVRAGLNRCRKSCRLRWLNYLKPSIKRGKLSNDEVDLLLRLHKLLGNRWSLIAGRLPNRTANDIKNYWNTHLSKKHELCCKTKIIKKKVVSAPSTTPAQKIDVLKPRPRSFSDCSHLNFLPEVEVDASWLGLNNNNVCESSITCKKDEEKDKLINDIMNGDNMWWESMLNESQEAGVLISEAMVSEKEATLAFDVEQLWSLFDEETVKLN